MDLFAIITMLGGLAFFLYGMHVLSAGLERMAGGKLEHALKKITSSRIKSLLLGIGITAAIQSSSAVTVMLVGLVNSGIMSIKQSIGVIMGSNIGTTMTAWILTLVGVESSNVFISLLKPENFSLVFAFVGILLIMVSKSDRKKDVGSILVGFAVLMYGMKLMSSAVKPLADMPEFTNLLTAFKNPILGVLVGLLITAVLQSSSASVGILQALALTGSVSYGAAIPIIMGQNIGTCVTALISSMGVSKNAKKVAVVHVTFNVVGTVLCMLLFYVADGIFQFAFPDMPVNAVGIAVIHSLFNVFTTAALLPCTSWIERFANRVLPDTGKEEVQLLDMRLLSTPSIAIEEADSRVMEMSTTAQQALLNAMDLALEYNEKSAQKVLEQESVLDRYEDALGTYLVQLSSKPLSETDSVKVSKMLHTINDFERLGDHAVNLQKSFRELHDKGLQFSENAQKEVSVLMAAIREILELAGQAYRNNDAILATRVEPLEQVIDGLVAAIKTQHIQRLQAGECSITLGFILSDMLGDFERISDHCSNIAVTVVEVQKRSFDTHQYLNAMKNDDETFKKVFQAFQRKYHI